MSDSLIGSDERELDRIMVQARTNNALDGTTGLLWTDGARFAQVLEGDGIALSMLLRRLENDQRHAALRVVEDLEVEGRQYGDWSMIRPAADTLAQTYERRIINHLRRLTDRSSELFRQIIAGATPPASA